MTKEEALAYFKRRKNMGLSDVCQQAEDMAIQALSQEPTVSRLERRVDDNTVVFRTIDGKEIEYVRKEPCDVSVSEKEPNEITEEVTLRFFKNSLKVRWHDFVIYNVEWLKKHWQMEMDIVCGVKPCDDAVSRQAVLDGLKGCICEDWVKTLFATMVKQLPSVTQKSGKWERVSIDTYVQHAMARYKCSVCDKWTIGEPNFCPNCGAKMESEDKE